MFNGDVKKEALERLKRANNSYQATAKRVAEKATLLHEIRYNSASNAIGKVENYVNKLANSPKEFDRSIEELKLSFADFRQRCGEVDDMDNVAVVSGSVSGAGVAAGVGVAAFGPTAALAVATTFGTASTGTAISALSGAAATNAALAWLGGGALAAGGGGMAAGQAFLALAGPVGWGVGGVALVGGAMWARSKNKKIAERATSEAISIEKKKGSLLTANKEIEELQHLTRKHSDGVEEHLCFLSNKAPLNYQQFDDDQKRELGALINNVNSLSKLIKKTIGND